MTMAIERIATASTNAAEIQAEIDRAEPGSVVHLGAGTIAGSFVISRPLTLRGAGAERTIVDARGRGPTIAIDAVDAEVRLEGLTITGGHGPQGAGVSIDNGARVSMV